MTWTEARTRLEGVLQDMPEPTSLPGYLRRTELFLMLWALCETGEVRTAARLLGMGRTTLYERLRSYASGVAMKAPNLR